MDWRKRRDVLLRSVPVEVDLDNRKVFFDEKLKDMMNLHFDTSNMDHLIHSFVAPEDTQHVMQSLLEAKQGKEQPIVFKFLHPGTSQKLILEYRYEIVYVTYSSTRLTGLLVNVPDTKRNIRKYKR